jgi:tRNA-uridine 2-sulfurtransferase
LRFPLGGWTKAEVRTRAAELGLITAAKAESQEICFIADGSYRTLLKSRFRERVRAGAILDESGSVVGEHQGIAMYTVGQRSGLQLTSSARASGAPVYVKAIDAVANTITVASNDGLLGDACIVDDVRYVSGHRPAGSFKAEVKVRSHAPQAAAIVTPFDAKAEIKFAEPQRALAPGQAAVFYDGDRLIGGGPIAATR